MKAEAKKCAVCGKKFTPKVVNSKCCSDKCRKEARKMRDAARHGTDKKAVKATKHEALKPVAKKPVKKVAGKAVEKISLPKHVSSAKVGKKFLLVTALIPLPSECDCKKCKSEKKPKQNK